MSGRCAILLVVGAIETATAQFTPELLQNNSYWSSQKAEVDLYRAEFIRDGQPHQCELLMILKRQSLNQLVRPDVPNQPRYAIQMDQIATIPRGLTLEQRSISVQWQSDLISLARLSFSGYDGTGHVIKTASQGIGEKGLIWRYSSDTYLSEVAHQEVASPNGTALFYDEMPFRVRMIDFAKANHEFEVQFLPTFATPQKEFGEFKPAKISWKIGEHMIDVDLRNETGTDHFVLDRDFPFLLREWRMADGSRLNLKNSLKVDYRNYLKNGDRERALKDPMSRHPD